ncbi:MAG: cold shock domain-containing protein [Hyphomicrobiales bacterium]|nr:cold shock domain-containing protein [Hyphomicrobiales bacterium]MCY4032808.1 cold shock domain-containing protein [Hyphomicrobiales bacterium]MCY4039105.1 cold shock domain-containing protein [Hyphomicrobiales bacterium]
MVISRESALALENNTKSDSFDVNETASDRRASLSLMLGNASGEREDGEGDACNGSLNGNGAERLDDDKYVAKGILKWFNPTRGYGFVTLEDSDEDALLHALCLKQVGRENIARGARITCRVARRPKGVQVTHLLSIDENGDFPFASPEQLQQGNAFERAVVKWFDPQRGYGFVSMGEDMLDIFVHTETLQRYNIQGLESGDEVLVRFWRGPKGLSASEIKLVLPEDDSMDEEF